MGGYQSKVQESPVRQNFSDNAEAPAKVVFSPTLLQQLKREHDERLHQLSQASRPSAFVIPQEPEELERERVQRYEKQKQYLEKLAAEREAIRQSEETALKQASEVLQRIEKRQASAAQSAPKSVPSECREYAEKVVQLLNSDKVDESLAAVAEYETCLRKGSQ